MNAINYLKDSLLVGVQEIQDLYQHRPPVYDIAVGVFRTSVIGLMIGTLASAKDDLIQKSLVPMLGISLFAYMEISSLIRWSNANKMSEDQSKKDVVLIFRAKSDLTGAANRLLDKDLEIFKKFAQTSSIVIKQVSTIADINDAIEEIYRQNRKIKTVYLTTHGEPDHIALGKEDIVGKDTVHSFIPPMNQKVCVDKIHFEKLDSRADIVLSSCSVGGKSGIVDGLNIAEWFQLYAGPHRRVFAPKTLLPNGGTNQTVASNGEFNYHFKSLLGSDITSDISYSNVLEKINKEQNPPSLWASKIYSIFGNTVLLITETLL